MIILSNSNAQTIAPGQSATFNTVILHTGCAECWRTNSGAVGLKCNGIYECSFGGNISGDSGAAQLAMALDSAPLLETTMTNGGEDILNVSCRTAVKNCCGSDSITIVNTGTVDVTIEANPCLFIKRIA